MATVVKSMATSGVDGFMVEIEASTIRGQQQMMSIIGLPDQAVKEAGERIQASIESCGYDIPKDKVIISLAPGDRKKRGSHFDLGMINYDPAPASVHEKVVRVRKGLKASSGKPLTQREFAKFIGYPINKYVEAEKVDRWSRRGDQDESEVEYELLEKLVMFCHANPYWLFDPDCEAYYAEDDLNAGAVLMGDEPCVYTTVDVILRWINEGKPRITCWEDGRV